MTVLNIKSACVCFDTKSGETLTQNYFSEAVYACVWFKNLRPLISMVSHFNTRSPFSVLKSSCNHQTQLWVIHCVILPIKAMMTRVVKRCCRPWIFGWNPQIRPSIHGKVTKKNLLLGMCCILPTLCTTHWG